MRPVLAFLFALLLAMSSAAFAADGLVTIKSPFTAQKTMNRLVKNAKQKKFTIFARIDHTANAEKVGLTLRPTKLLIFGNPKGGTPFMKCAQTVGIDLPMKALVWRDASGQVWLGYNSPAYIAKRHDVPNCPAVEKISDVLSTLAKMTVAK